MEPFRVHILGCGSALPTLRHNASAQVVEVRDKLFMVDCGEGTQMQLRRSRIRFTKIGHVFISHLHGDHCFGLIGMISTFGMLGRTARLHVYATAELGPMLQSQLDMFCDRLGFEVELRDADDALVKRTSVDNSWSSTLECELSGLTNLRLWSAENPQLYTIVVRQKGSNNQEEMVFSTRYGFRQIEQREQLVYINGQRVYFKGVNTQDTHPVTGRTLNVETMLEDVTMMKKANMNTVRTSHYPRQAKMMAMFDYYGIYVMDEADIESHKDWADHGPDVYRPYYAYGTS